MSANNLSLSAATSVRVDLEQNTPLFPEGELRQFVERFLARRDDFLSVLAASPPPLYVLEQDVLAEKARLFKDAFRRYLSDTGFYYAVKSNNHPDVSKILLRAGMGLDVSSGPELEMALGLGAEDIIFSGPGKTDVELLLAVNASERVTILIDSFGELARLAAIAESRSRTVRTGVRLTTNPHGVWRKFGILPEQLAHFLEQAGRCSGIDCRGLQFHTSWNLSPAAQIDFIRLLGQVLAGLEPAAREQIRFIDIGGGYWPSQGEWLQEEGTAAGRLRRELGLKPGSRQNHYRLPAEPIDVFAGRLSDAVHRYIHPLTPCRICFEPGRWLCNDAMHLLISVVDKKCDDLVITDAGTNAVGWERFETDYFPVLNLSRPALTEKPCSIFGALCTPHDIWGYNYWGEDIRVGDILLIPTQGAYTYSLRQHFIKPLPEVVSI